jgi:hypothetical protein
MYSKASKETTSRPATLTAHQYVLSTPVQQLLDQMMPCVSTQEDEERANRINKVVKQFAKFQLAEKIADRDMVPAMLLAASGLYACHLDEESICG